MTNHRPAHWADPDVTLLQHIRNTPHLLDHVQQNATRLLPVVAGRYNNITGAHHEAWNEAKLQTQQCGAIFRRTDNDGAGPEYDSARVKQLRVALEVEAFFTDLMVLTPLENAELGDQWKGIGRTARSREIMQARPALAHFLAKQDARAAHAAEAQARQIAESNRKMPETLLASVRQRGVRIALGKDGTLIAPPGSEHLLFPSELAALKEWKGAIVALLKAELGSPENSKPVVLA